MTGSPSFANSKIFNPATGVSKVNVNRFDAIETLDVNLALLGPAALAYLLKLWRGGYGNAVGFRVLVPYDYTMTLEPQGTIAASTTAAFNLVKTYKRPGVIAREDVRRIIKPVVATNLAGGSATLYEADGVTARVILTAFAVQVGSASTGFTYTINNTTGVLTVTTTTANGIVTVTCQFDVPMRFSGNSFPLTKFDVDSEVKGIQLEEILPAEFGL
jgi:uncharacterized protein (TIGR02217 family)